MSTVIYVVTPCLEAADTIDRTIISVLSQAGDFFIRYHVRDAGSTDGTLERLQYWQQVLAKGNFPLHCHGVDYTFLSEPDNGMYDAIVTAFEWLGAQGDEFLTWINGDDILMPGALATIAAIHDQFTPAEVSWVEGAVAVLKDDMLIRSEDQPVPTAAIKAGLCDGTHWSYIQQEGTFFRKRLWSSADPATNIRPMRYAGDWNLWRLFAANASLYQLPFPTGAFRRREGQMSVRARSQYCSEIAGIVSNESRREALRALASSGSALRRCLQANHTTGRYSAVEESTLDKVRTHFVRVFGHEPATPVPAKTAAKRVIFSNSTAAGKLRSEPEADPALMADGIITHDRAWQYPAITEQHAFHRMRESRPLPCGVRYVAYPWATLIDKLNTDAPDAQDELKRFHRFCTQIPRDGERFTICQHILMRRFEHLFRLAKIDHVFWSHTTRADLAANNGRRPGLYPFPLYPAQMTTEFLAPPDHARRYLFSFVGASHNDFYLTDIRHHIVHILGDDPRGQVVERDQWHYHDVVYEQQVLGRNPAGAPGAQPQRQSDAQEFVGVLRDSVFSLCPSGSGPNSIRLWESIAAGAIPVILSDTYAPPGDQRLWEAAALFCEETPEAVRALPEELARIAAVPERLEQMRHAMRQLWLLYGPDSFITDIQLMMLRRAGDCEAQQADHPMGFPVDTLHRLAMSVNRRGQAREEDCRLLLTSAGTLLLADGAHMVRRLAVPALRRAIRTTIDRLGAADPVVVHFLKLESLARRRHSPPKVVHGASESVIAVCLLGRHSHRTPLSYAPLQRAANRRIRLVDNPAVADVVVTGFNIDLRENAATLAALLKLRPEIRIVVISEEPLWDTCWAQGFVERDRVLRAGDDEIPYRFLNHENSDIFSFDQVPYFVLTNDRFLLRYQSLLAPQPGLGAQSLLQRWSAAPYRAAFYLERRNTDVFAPSFPERDIEGLSVYRTRVAEMFDGDGVLRVGKGWQDECRRQDLPDWHLDKLTMLRNRTRMLSAIENTHHNTYVTEKPFDAFAAGAIPVYHAGPRHRVFQLLPAQAMINTFGLEPDAAAKRMEDFRPDAAFADAYLETQRRLHRLFTDFEIVTTERQRIINATIAELERWLERSQ
jgi:hypothetical protein